MMREPAAVRARAAEEALEYLIAGALENLACHMQSGRPRSAVLAAMLLDRLARDPDVTTALRLGAQQLRDVLEDGMFALPLRPTTGPVSEGHEAPRRPPRGSGTPWLTWENLSGMK